MEDGSATRMLDHEPIEQAIERTSFDGYDVFAGDCVCVAAALQSVFGGEYVGGFTHEADVPDEPAHLTVRIGGELYDGGGQTSKEALEDRAFAGGAREFNDVVVVELPALTYKANMETVPEVKKLVARLETTTSPQ